MLPPENGSPGILHFGKNSITDVDAAAVRQVDAADQVQKGTFANPAFSDDDRYAAKRKPGVHILKNNLLFLAVAKGFINIGKPDFHRQHLPHAWVS
jgi:hypothetical protein